MNVGRVTVGIALLLLGWGCGGPAPVQALGSEARAVQVRRAWPPEGARYIGTVQATHGHGCGSFASRGTHDGIVAALKFETARLGGNYVFVTDEREPHMSRGCWDWSWTMQGRAYLVGKP